MKKVVVKFGSSIIAPRGKLDTGLIAQFIEDILTVEKKGYAVIVVSSGAIACGLSALGYKRKPQDTHRLMALASLGQILLMDAFNQQCNARQRHCAQMLLTWDDFDNRRRFNNIRSTLNQLLSMNIIPVINENDAVSCEEIRLGDNDCISARVADLCQADLLVILSDVEGLLDGDIVVNRVERIDQKVVSLVRQEDKTHTHGGMQTKLQAARIATAAGVRTVIAGGRIKGALVRIIDGEGIGTLFTPAAIPAAARKRWILFSKKVKGKIFIDQGAQAAITQKGKSLLAVGIVSVEGTFRSQDSVSIVDSNNSIIGYGIVNYDSNDLCQARAKKFEREVIHRDNFALVSDDGGSCSPKL